MSILKNFYILTQNLTLNAFKSCLMKEIHILKIVKIGYVIYAAGNSNMLKKMFIMFCQNKATIDLILDASE